MNTEGEKVNSQSGGIVEHWVNLMGPWAVHTTELPHLVEGGVDHLGLWLWSDSAAVWRRQQYIWPPWTIQ
jgi:hypothetical protein